MWPSMLRALTFSPGRSVSVYMMSCGLMRFTARNQGLPLRRQLDATPAQPGHAHRRDDVVVQVSAASVRDDVADAEVVAESGRPPSRR